jgi:hypothetical protein
MMRNDGTTMTAERSHSYWPSGRALTGLRRSRGFTAMEIAMVATVIAIFALLVLPVFRNRVEEAKIAAANADLVSLMKAEILCKADTSHFVRLEDLDNTENNTPIPVPVNGITVETPPFRFPADGNPAAYQLFGTTTEWQNFAGPVTAPKWKGPYTVFQRHVKLADFVLANSGTPPNSGMMRATGAGTNTSPSYRPIQNYHQGSPGAPSGAGLFDSDENRIPTDPWGNPYLFYPPIQATATAFESAYAVSWIVCLGPNGLPGDGNGIIEDHFLRGYFPAKLGTGDDLMVQF